MKEITSENIIDLVNDPTSPVNQLKENTDFRRWINSTNRVHRSSMYYNPAESLKEYFPEVSEYQDKALKAREDLFYKQKELSSSDKGLASVWINIARALKDQEKVKEIPMSAEEIAKANSDLEEGKNAYLRQKVGRKNYESLMEDYQKSPYSWQEYRDSKINQLKKEDRSKSVYSKLKEKYLEPNQFQFDSEATSKYKLRQSPRGGRYWPADPMTEREENLELISKEVDKGRAS